MNNATIGAQILAGCFSKAGISTVFTLSGNQIMPVFDACIDSGTQLVHVRQEAAAVYMAEAWAQLTGLPGVALVAAGPAFANALSPLYSARQSETPVVLVSGDSPVIRDGQMAFQAMDLCAVSRPLVKRSTRVTDVSDLHSILSESFHVAQSGRPGPVHVAVPQDMLTASVTIESSPVPDPGTETASPDPAVVAEIAGPLAAAARPLVLTGPRMNPCRAGEILKGISQNLDVPVISMESPRALKDPAQGELVTALTEADLVLCLGRKVDYTIGFGELPVFSESCGFMVVDAEQEALDLAASTFGNRLLIATRADPVPTGRALGDAFTECHGRDPEWRSRVAGLINRRCPVPDTQGQGEKMHPGLLATTVQQWISRREDCVLVIDGGEFGQWSQALVSNPNRIINGPGGAIGGGICYAIAAKSSRPTSTVVAMMGDGTAGFHLGEFETALRCNAPFIAIIGNDNRWNAEHQLQLREYGPDRLVGCDLSPTRFDQVVRGMGGFGEYVTRIEDLPGALDRANASDLPACINVEIMSAAAPTLGA